MHMLSKEREPPLKPVPKALKIITKIIQKIHVAQESTPTGTTFYR